MSLFNSPFDERLFRIEVENVELVDPGRHDQEWPLEHLVGGRLVLDQLHQRVLEDDHSGRDGEIAADREFARVRLPDPELPASAFDVLRQQLHAANQVLAIRGESFPQKFRVGEHPVRRGDRVDQLLGVEPRLLLGVGIKSSRFADQVLCPVGCNQIGLPHEVEEQVLRPGWVLEPIVLGGGSGHLATSHAHRFEHGGTPEISIRLPELRLSLEDGSRLS